jgi:surfactin synthase thioesterase subunit
VIVQGKYNSAQLPSRRDRLTSEFSESMAPLATELGLDLSQFSIVREPLPVRMVRSVFTD